MRNQRSVRTAYARGVAGLLALTTILTGGRSTAAPADIFSSPAPVLGAAPQKAADLRDGEASVSTQTGAMTYSYPITVPPGRGGMAPKLSLNYSSQAPIYGTIASGWSLPIPAIIEDPSQSPLRHRSPEVDAPIGPYQALADDRYISTLAGNRPLVRVTEPKGPDARQAYRAQNDSTFTRYEELDGTQGWWRALSSTGTVMTFGTTSRMGGCPVGRRFAPMTGQIDSFGNEVAYYYEWNPVLLDCHIAKIEWGMNPAAGITQPFARVAFTWEPVSMITVNGVSVAPGSTRNYRSGALMASGAMRLTTITTTAFPPGGAVEHTRQIRLGYDLSAETASGNITHAPVRLLSWIQESAWGATSAQARVDLPSINFTYESPTVQLNAGESSGETPWFDGVLARRNLGWGYRFSKDPADDRWPSVEAMMVDLDGDGLLDRLTNTSANTPDGSISQCMAEWQRNLGPDANGRIQFSPANAPFKIDLPRLKWGGDSATALTGGLTKEYCSLNGQATTYKNSHAVGSAGLCHTDNQPCKASSNPDQGTKRFCYPGGATCPLDPGGNGTNADYRTYLAYRWLDADGDGLTDLVAAIHGDSDTYDPDVGNGVGPGYVRTDEPAPFGLGVWPQCPAQIEQCKENMYSCLGEAMPCAGLCTTNWTKVNQCLTTAVSTGCFNITSTMGAPQSGGPVQRAPYSRCEGLYPWFIFKNSGNGQIAKVPTVKYQPVPLESESGDSQVGGNAVFSQDHAVMDFDGDGWLDGIAREEAKTNPDGTTKPMPDVWWVWLGDGTGGMGPKRYYFPTRRHEWNGVKGRNRIAAANGNVLGTQILGVLDVNADGLPDHWLDNGNGTANVTFNDGIQFQTWGTAHDGDTNLPVNPSNVSVVAPGAVYEPFTSIVQSGDAVMTSRPVDVDNDGRIDVVKIDSAEGGYVYYNVGGQLLATGSPYPGASFGARRQISASVVADQHGDRIWELRKDLMDLDGDGIPEAVTANGTTYNRYVPAGPPRLLKTIQGGSGGMATTTVTYASMHSAAVTQTPGSTWFDGRPKATPATQWVVSSINFTDPYATVPTSTTTTYQYANPRHGKDDTGHYGFRGFESVTTTSQSGAKTKEVYGYDVDWSGRLVRRVVHAAENPGAAVSVDTTTYGAFTLFGGAITTFEPTLTEHHTCADGQTEASCVTTPLQYTRTASTYVAQASTTAPGAALMYVASKVRTQHARTAANGDRESTFTHLLASDATTYRLRPDTIVNSEQRNGAMTMYGKSRVTWNTAAPAYARKLTDEAWADTVDANRSVTTYNYEAATGNLLSITSPSGQTTTYEYDPRKLFVVAENNPLAHRVELEWEYGTGTKTVTRGPQVAGCIQNGSCTSNPPGLTMNTTKLVIDGLGRTRERWESVTVDPGGQAYFELRRVGALGYYDGAPNMIFESSLVKYDAAGTPVWAQTYTELDGHGRTRAVAVSRGGGPIPSAVTTYTYRNDGTLQSVSMPDPSQDSTATVTYSYTFDSLGRPTSIRRPDSEGSGADMGYLANTTDGVTTWVRERAASPAKIAETRRRYDADGRLQTVKEKLTASTWATTTYAYDAANNTRQITDAEGKITTLEHDFLGHRKRIRRNNRDWDYAYDAGGRLTSETVPCTPQPTCRAAYTTTYAYDSLDRITTRNLAPRTLSSTDRALFGAEKETFVYDTGVNNRGRLSQWFSWGPGDVVKQNQVFNHDEDGRQTMNWMRFNTAGYNAERVLYRSYLVSGLPNRVAYGDAISGSAGSYADYDYDIRGLPLSVSIVVNQVPYPVILTRNVAGLVTRRRADQFGGTGKFFESNWTYDNLGRVTNQTVNQSTGQVARQALTYVGNDDVSSLTTYFGTTAKGPLNFTHDFRHQLTNVTTTGGYYTAAYTYGNAGRLRRATVSRGVTVPSGDVRARDYFYNYQGTDPEVVTSLSTGNFAGSGGTNAVTYTIDAIGNQIARIGPTSGERIDFVYDGANRLRRATKKVNGVVTGSEEYWYDSAGSRSHVVKRGANSAVTGMVWYHGEAEAHYDPAATTAKQVYSHVSLGTPIARIDRTSDTVASIEFQFHGLGDSTLTTVAFPNSINTTFNYGPFGDLLESTTSAGSTGIGTHKRRFNDKVQDDLTGLSYYGARYYDRLLLGWTQLDPLYLRAPDLGKQSTPRRSNLGVFSLNNPIRYMDPDGRDSVAAAGAKTFSEQYNADAKARAAAAGGDDMTETHVQRAYEKWLDSQFWVGGGSAPDIRTTGRCDPGLGFCMGSPEDLEDVLAGKMTVEDFLNKPPSPESMRTGLAILASLAGRPDVGFAIGMSGAKNENEIAPSMIGFAAGQAASGLKAVAGSGQRTLPSALQGGQATTHVYFGVLNGQKVYVGITNNIMRRAAQHGARFKLQPITTQAVTRGQARAIEQALIVRNPGFQNIRNSISPRHSWYDDAVAWGEQWLKAAGH